MQRRFWLLGMVVLVGAAYALQKAGPLKGSWAPEEVAPGVHVIHGPRELPNPGNQGFMNNPAFLVTDNGVVVVDPGSSVQVGEMVLERIAQVTDKPVLAVFNSHIHGDHWLGNQAIKQAYPDAVIYAHERMIERRKDRF